jgi:hypothetical protein
LKKKTVCARFVPHLLTPNQKHQRPAWSVEFVEMTDDDRNVLKRIVTDPEILCSMHDPETKRQPATWLSPRKPKTQKVGMQKSWMKTMLTAYFDVKGIIHHEFVPEKQIVNGKCYREVIKRLIARVHRVRPEFRECGSWYLLHNNASAHSLGVVFVFLRKRGIPVLSHPP